MWSVACKAARVYRQNKRNRVPIAVRSFSNPSGLYGFPHLKTAKGFRPFVDEAIERAGELVSYIFTKPLAPEIMRAMDEISDALCSVVDSAELCRNTHPIREFVEEASEAAIRINEYIQYMNTNHDLYDVLKKAEQECHMLSEEGRRGVRSLRVDFENGGIHLCPEKLNRVNMLNSEISELSIEYSENIVKDPGTVDIYPSSRIPKHLHYLVKPIYRSESLTTKDLSTSRETHKEKGFQITTDSQTLASILQLSSDDEVRKIVYIRGNSVPHANVDVLKRLISARHELAQLLEYRSYAEFAVKLNMASSPKVVMSFLLEMSKMVQDKAKEERKLLTKFKREKWGQSGDLRPWDEAYYMTVMKSSVHKLDSSVVDAYFSLSNCIEGLKVLVQSLFGATFHSIPLAPGESWDPQVLKLSLHHPEEIVALVCNFSGSQNPSAVRLNPSEVETLFHEFGHALHSLLSRTDYQHFSGTRAVLDFAEIPSNLFEYYARDYRVLKKFARHYSTGEEIPQKLAESIQGTKDIFAATELQRQIFYALVDQTLYGEKPLPYGDPSSVVAELKREHTNWEHVEGTHWESRFSHLINYGAGYYSYLYAKCFAATIWKRLCQEDPLSPATGFALRTKFLQHGGARDPAALLNDLVGDGIHRYDDGGIMPDISSLCEEMNLIEEYKRQVHLL
ncbi:mitochondrial intermediate peptidase, mitochondrial isoform X2 [Abrus precatorius]|uniref:Mitochondrial intermediate peptidase, mitochondrial isoform X2 n=1 Tax=Abrus precatorius TaxID=3816 RepID=A0A8B8JK45_ABRPR|nr:mitochondrial intermediate peptidase, mitochondrial isoform X2 [Abrus precatorius]